MTTNTFQSCLTCPSYLRAEETTSKFKKSIGSPMCGRYGIVLGKPGLNEQQSAKLANHFGSKCDAYGEAMPPLPIEKRLTVALPDPEVRKPSDVPGAATLCRTCGTCTKFVGEQYVADELGWTAGLCAAKGKLILSNQQSFEARDC